MSVVVRPGIPDDAWAVAVCQSTCWEQTYRGHALDAYLDGTGPRERVPRWQARLVAGGVWLAEADGEVLGVASAGPSRDDPPVRERELMTLYTLARVHGTGVGAALLDAAVGRDPASLWVFSGNQRARAFYRRHGFAPDGAEADDLPTGLRELRMVR